MAYCYAFGRMLGKTLMRSDDEITKEAFKEFAGAVAHSVSMRNAHMKGEMIAEVVDKC